MYDAHLQLFLLLRHDVECNLKIESAFQNVKECWELARFEKDLYLLPQAMHKESQEDAQAKGWHFISLTIPAQKWDFRNEGTHEPQLVT